MYPVIHVPDDAADFPEALGTKPKFWFSKETRLYRRCVKRGHSPRRIVLDCTPLVPRRQPAKAFFVPFVSSRPLTTLAAFEEGAKISSRAARHWLGKLEQLSIEEIQAIIAEVPLTAMSTPARRFSAKMIEVNRDRLLRPRTKPQ